MGKPLCRACCPMQYRTPPGAFTFLVVGEQTLVRRRTMWHSPGPRAGVFAQRGGRCPACADQAIVAPALLPVRSFWSLRLWIADAGVPGTRRVCAFWGGGAIACARECFHVAWKSGPLGPRKDALRLGLREEA